MKITRSERDRDLTNRRYERWAFGDEVEKSGYFVIAINFPRESPVVPKQWTGWADSTAPLCRLGRCLVTWLGETNG